MQDVASRAVDANLDEDARRWALAEPSTWDSFGVRSAESGGWTSHFAIDGMHCTACSLVIERALLAVPGVSSARVDGPSRRAEVSWTAGVTNPSLIVSGVERAGYAARPGQSPDSASHDTAVQRKLLWRWLVAGFCMMQVMMYAVPGYMAGEGDISPEMSQLLRWASWVLTLPVIAFSCVPFFRHALADIRALRITMDLPVGLGMAIAFGVSTAGTFAPQGPFGAEVYFDSLTMFVFFLLSGRWLEQRLRHRTAGALEALIDRIPATVLRQVFPQGRFERIVASRLVVGDVVRVTAGECFPADGTLVHGRTQVDEALLTGESKPVWRAAPSSQDAAQLTGNVIAGSCNRGSEVLMRVDRLGTQTRFSQIVALMRNASMSKPRLAALADRIAAPFLACVMLAAAGSLAWWWPTDPAKALMVCVSVLIVTCPCALSLATPAAMLAAAGTLARGGVLVRHLQGLEALAGADTVVFDKTGTLTDDALELRSVKTRGGVEAAWALQLAAVLAAASSHPISRAISASAGKAANATGAARTAVLPDEIVETAGAGLAASFAGGRALRLGSASFCGMRVSSPNASGDTEADTDPDTKAPATAANFTVVAHLADEQGWLATFSLDEAIRPDAHAAIDALRDAGLDVMLLSGDRPASVAHIARSLGIRHATGRCTPERKLARVLELQQLGRRVVMVGDGLNDAPVLAAADVSFAVGPHVPLARSQADFVILGGELSVLPVAVLLARRTLRIVKQNLGWAVAYNAVTVPIALAGWLPAWLAGLGMAASSLLVVANAARVSNAVRQQAREGHSQHLTAADAASHEARAQAGQPPVQAIA
ncbi:heavy metal translocating P-type ATPase [soil metagenome]